VLIPWHVDVPGDHYPFLNWLIIAGIILAFVAQRTSIKNRRAMLDSKQKEYANSSVEEMAKELGADEQRVKEIEQAVEKKFAELKKVFPAKKDSKDSKDSEDFRAKMKEDIIKRSLLEEFFVLGQVRPYILRGWTIKGLLGNMWLHGGIFHILGNLLFLWIFGNAVCSKMGNLLYAPFYILMGIMAGIAHLMFQGGSAVGASGAINGVVGIFLVFFPINAITCYYSLWFFLRPHIGSFTIASFWMILFWLAFDIYGATAGDGRPVAYFAHLGGFTAGVGVGIILLKCKIVKMEKWDKSLLEVLADPFNRAQPELNTKYNADLRLLKQTENGQPQETVKLTPIPAAPEIQQVLSNSDFLRPPPPEPPEQQPEPSEQPEPSVQLEPQQQQFIRFACECGKKIKMASKHAGRMGKCPQCRKRIRIPQAD